METLCRLYSQYFVRWNFSARSIPFSQSRWELLRDVHSTLHLIGVGKGRKSVCVYHVPILGTNEKETSADLPALWSSICFLFF